MKRKKKFTLPSWKAIDRQKHRTPTGSIIYANDAVNICYEASKTCVAGKIVYDYMERCEYLKKRVRDAHESVLEHSNLVMVIKTPANADLAKVLASSKYIRAVVSQSEAPYDCVYVLLGGSIRGYKNLIKDTYDQNNAVLKQIKDLMNESVQPELLIDFADSYAFDLNWTGGNKTVPYCMEDTDQYMTSKTYDDDHRHIMCTKYDDKIEYINIDPIAKIFEAVRKYGFTICDVIEVCSVTIKFKNMSRAAATQLIRHRNAITQESQRYVSSKGIGFVNPATYKPEKHYEDKTYDINFSIPGVSVTNEFTLDELATVLVGVYNNLEDHGLLKEDARYYLPQGVCTTVYMTFTMKSLFQFLQLRCDPHAQAEIRSYANIIRDTFVGNYWRRHIDCDDPTDNDIVERMLIPKYMYSERYIEVTAVYEDIGTPTETVEQVQATAEISSDPEEEMKDFGLTGDRPAPPDKSLEAAEAILSQYDPNRYADTRDDSKEIKE